MLYLLHNIATIQVYHKNNELNGSSVVQQVGFVSSISWHLVNNFAVVVGIPVQNITQGAQNKI